MKYIFTGLICLIFAYLIGYKKILSFLINYSEFTFLGDKERLAKRMGLILLTIGILTIIMPILLIVFGTIIKSIYFGVVIILVIVATSFIIVPYFQVK